MNILKRMFYKMVFNKKWYLNKYLDVKESGMDAWVHYYKYGYYEGRKCCDRNNLFNIRGGTVN